jgi:hypothetical protein
MCAGVGVDAALAGMAESGSTALAATTQATKDRANFLRLKGALDSCRFVIRRIGGVQCDLRPLVRGYC